MDFEIKFQSPFFIKLKSVRKKGSHLSAGGVTSTPQD